MSKSHRIGRNPGNLGLNRTNVAGATKLETSAQAQDDFAEEVAAELRKFPGAKDGPSGRLVGRSDRRSGGRTDGRSILPGGRSDGGSNCRPAGRSVSVGRARPGRIWPPAGPVSVELVPQRSVGALAPAPAECRGGSGAGRPRARRPQPAQLLLPHPQCCRKVPSQAQPCASDSAAAAGLSSARRRARARNMYLWQGGGWEDVVADRRRCGGGRWRRAEADRKGWMVGT